MLHSVNDLVDYAVAARDGHGGELREMYFDDRLWVLRHWVLDTGGLSGRRVLLAPSAICGIEDKARQLRVALSCEQLNQAPSVESDPPLSRHHDAAAYDPRRYPELLSGASLWGIADLPPGGLGAPPLEAPPPSLERGQTGQAAQTPDPHLRSSADVVGYDVSATDGSIGHVADFLVDPDIWQIVLIVVDTHNWLPDRLVLVPPLWIDGFDGSSRQVSFRVTRQAVQASPPYEPNSALPHEQVLRVQRHFEGWL